MPNVFSNSELEYPEEWYWFPPERREKEIPHCYAFPHVCAATEPPMQYHPRVRTPTYDCDPIPPGEYDPEFFIFSPTDPDSDSDQYDEDEYPYRGFSLDADPPHYVELKVDLSLFKFELNEDPNHEIVNRFYVTSETRYQGERRVVCSCFFEYTECKGHEYVKQLYPECLYQHEEKKIRIAHTVSRYDRRSYDYYRSVENGYDIWRENQRKICKCGRCINHRQVNSQQSPKSNKYDPKILIGFNIIEGECGSYVEDRSSQSLLIPPTVSWNEFQQVLIKWKTELEEKILEAIQIMFND